MAKLGPCGAKGSHWTGRSDGPSGGWQMNLKKHERLLFALRRIPSSHALHCPSDDRRRHCALSSTTRMAVRWAQISHTDFRLLAGTGSEMNGGGVYLNIGSAVTLPEVFLKCVTLVRNLGHPLSSITTANFDFIQSYRPLTNVVRRPTADGAGRGFAIRPCTN